MEGADLLTAGVLFLFAAVAAVPLAAAGHRRGIRYLLAGIAIGPWGWDLSATLTRSCTFPNWASCF